MKKIIDVLSELKENKQKITVARRAIIEVFLSTKSVYCAKDIIYILSKQLVHVDKTTVYREINFLKLHGIIHEIEFGEGKKYYEVRRKHHHHLVCTECHKIDHLSFDSNLLTFEDEIKKKSRFKTKSHSLEFFGICKDCQYK